MKHTYILFILIISIFFLESCRKEEIIEEEPIITIDPPGEIQYPVVTGVVSNSGDPLPESNVNIYQDGTFIGKVLTDQEGKFNTAEYSLESDGKITLDISKTEFASAYRRRNVLDLVDTELEINLVSLDLFDIGTNPLDDPGSEELFSFSGYIKDLLGQPSTGFVAVEWEIGNIYHSYTTYTDLNGYYELLLPIDTELRVSISDTICNNYLTEEEVTIFLNLEAEYFGPFAGDVILPDYINPYSSEPSILIDGVVVDCNGNPNSGSEITFHFNDNETFDYYIVHSLDADGVFLFEENECLKLPYELTIYAYDYINNKTTDSLFYLIQESETMITLPSFAACNDGDLSLSEVIIESEGVTHSFSQTVVRKENGHLISDELTLNGATFRIPDVELGTNMMEDFSALNWDTGETFVGVEGTVILEITTLSDHKAIGSFTGTFTNKDNLEVVATGQINLNF